MKDFLLGRLELAKYLYKDAKIGVHYIDVASIITAVLSACSACRWPGKRIDKARYIELLVKYSCEKYHTSWVSIPALLDEGLIKNSETPYRDFGNMCRIYTGCEIDLPLQDAQQKYPQLSSRDLRECTYASLIYKWLRCGYAHEYWHNENITHVPPTDDKALVSYIGRGSIAAMKRMIFFPLDSLFNLAEHHVSILPSNSESNPRTWWINKA